MKRGARCLRAAAAGALALLAAGAAAAHPLAPSLLELEEQADGRVLARFTTSRTASGGARALPVLPERCRPVGDARPRAEDARVVSEQLLDCGPRGLAGAEVRATGLAETASALILRVALASGGAHQALLVASRPRFEVPEGASAARVLLDYGRLGAAHLAGLDHLLFIAGLFLLVPRARALVATLTAFTLGHSATLSLVALGAPSPPAVLVEAGIAASLVALALELATGARGPLAARPGIASAALGLLHGLGFAGALRAIGLPADAVPLALFSFNAGIELAQLAFAAALTAAALALRAAQPAGALLPGRALACHGLGAAGAFLFLERVIGALAP